MWFKIGYKIKGPKLYSLSPLNMAERVGFEPTYGDEPVTRFRVERVTAGLRYLSSNIYSG